MLTTSRKFQNFISEGKLVYHLDSKYNEFNVG